MCSMRSSFCVLGVLAALVQVQPLRAAEGTQRPEFPLFAYLTGQPTPTMVAYAPSELDPRLEANHLTLASSSIRADLQALRPVFDGLVLYGYHEQSTPRIVAVAKELKFRGLLLGIWNPKSAAEIDGIVALVSEFQGDLALGVVVGNEGLTFHRYEPEDLTFAAARLRANIPPTIPLTTSEPLARYRLPFLCQFGDFLAPNIHPVHDRPRLLAPEAAAWAREQAADLARRAKKPVLVKETGFPHGGKQQFTPQTQQAFWTAYLAPGILFRLPDLPAAWVFHGVAFEAFDLPWKAKATNMPMEEFWGLLSPQRKAHTALSVWAEIARQKGHQTPP